MLRDYFLELRLAILCAARQHRATWHPPAIDNKRRDYKTRGIVD